jgi:hypothetical protein
MGFAKDGKNLFIKSYCIALFKWKKPPRRYEVINKGGVEFTDKCVVA